MGPFGLSTHYTCLTVARLTILIDRHRIAQRVAEMGQQLTAELEAERLALQAKGQTVGPVVLVPILTGAMLLTSDLIRVMETALSIRPVTLSSYPGRAMSSQGVTIASELPADLQGKRVIVLDDIFDSGRTLGLVRRVFAAQNPQSLRVGVLLSKRKADQEPVQIDLSGFEIEDEFVVGYGMDYDGLYRNLPDICVLHPEATQAEGKSHS
jgi:hypoxanthine phosphoribosyltransferase